MFNGIAKLFGTAPTRAVDAVVSQVIESSLEGVCRLVDGRVNEMSLSEARGYVRARAAQLIACQSRQAISRSPESNLSWTPTVARAATERIIPLVLRQTGVGVPRSASLPKAA